MLIETQNSDVATVARLFDDGADPNETEPSQDSPLLTAVTRGDPAIVEALMLAARQGYRTIVEALLDAGAEPNLRDKAGKNAAELALERRHLEVHDVIFLRMKRSPAEPPQGDMELRK